MKTLLKIIVCVFLSTSLFGQSLREIKLDSNWTFRRTGEKKWMPAKVPGTIHTDLFANNKIPDPFFGINEKKIQWIDTCDWEYQCLFTLSQDQLAQNKFEIQFDGLDTYAKIFLNNSLILTTDNMFRFWKTDVQKKLKVGENKLIVRFESSVKKGKILAKKLAHTLPGEEKVFTRKAQYHYGWDWGPRFVTCGIWKNVRLFSVGTPFMSDIHFTQKSLSDSMAKLEFVCTVHSSAAKNFSINIHEEKNEHQNTYSIIQTKYFSGAIEYTIEYFLPNPELWWCRGTGDPHLYDFTFSLFDSKMKPVDAKKITLGLRTLELIQDKDSIGTSFYFRLNGVPVFMKGANYIPQDNFVTRVVAKDYQTLIKSSVEANMNMLRVWGGGIYADDEFYDQCDRNGILVWQDFMFACAMYPGDSAFTNNVKSEVSEQVKRLRNHASIALWCGNNEIDEGWNNWGWQKEFNYSFKDSTRIGDDYKFLFEKTIPDILDTEMPSHNYVSSSPQIGWGNKKSLTQGDSHYWGVWWGMEPFELYDQKVGRFMSEYGFQGMPPLETFKQISDEKDWSLASAAVKNHQKHPTGFQTIQTYLERDYKQPKDFENYIYVSQLLQAEGIKTAMEAHRRAKPYCMGSLYWQFNDCWPVTSWSSIDYFGNRKALYYSAQHSFSTILVSVKENKDSLSVYIVSDSLKSFSGNLNLQVIDFNGKEWLSENYYQEVASNTSRLACIIPLGKMRGLFQEFNDKVLIASLAPGNKDWRAEYYFSKPKDLMLSKPGITVTTMSNHALEIRSDVLAKNVYLSVKDGDVQFSENYFDVFPGEKKIISITSGTFSPENLRLKSLFDTY